MTDNPAAPIIRQLTIERFRSIKSLDWNPESGVNVILGGGDVGKTTILDAIGLLLSPTNPSVVPDTDYHARIEDDGFVIEAVMSLPADSGISDLVKPAWPWDWNGKEAMLPAIGDDSAAAHNCPVYRFRVTGTPDLELLYEIVQPDGETDTFPVALRRQIGLVRLSGDDRNDRDLRFVQGSALDRLLSDKSLRSRLANKLAETEVREGLSESAAEVLQKLDEAFEKKALPHGLDLAITGGPGLSIMALIGLTAEQGGVSLPLSSWGAGTRRLAALAIAEQNQRAFPITLVDEMERGLEPYRQRALVGKLQSNNCQTFVTTHSAAALGAATQAAIWYVDHNGVVGRLDSTKISKHQIQDPEAFLSRLAIVAEGATEVGFVTVLLERALASPLQDHGLYVSDGTGHETTLELLEALSNGGVRFAGFADDENKYPERWAVLKGKLNNLLFRWASGGATLSDRHLRRTPGFKRRSTCPRHVAAQTGREDSRFRRSGAEDLSRHQVARRMPCLRLGQPCC